MGSGQGCPRMTIEITRPEIESLIRQRLQSGAFVDAADVILRALKSFTPEPQPAFDKQRAMAAGARIRELSQGLALGGLTIRQLIDEGRP
jgi:hypothetical protein